MNVISEGSGLSKEIWQNKFLCKHNKRVADFHHCTVLFGQTTV